MSDYTFHIHVAAWVWPFAAGILAGVVLTIIGLAFVSALSMRSLSV